jgi:hypothetical protein
MEKWIFVVRTNCTDESREDKFNEWYDNVHVPDVMGTAGFLKAERYCSPEWSSYDLGRYLAIYEIETDDINKTMKTLFERMGECFKKGRLSELIRPMSFGLFKPVSSFSK